MHKGTLGLVVVSFVLALWSGCSGDTGTSSRSGSGGGESPHTDRARSALEVVRAAKLLTEASARPALRQGAFEVKRPRGTVQLPEDARGTTRLIDRGDPDRSISITATGRGASIATLDDRVLTYRDAATDTDVVAVVSHHRGALAVEEHRVLWTKAAPMTATYEVTVGKGLRSIRARAGILEVLDHDERVAFHTLPARIVDAVGTARIATLDVEERAGHWLVTARLDDSDGLTYPVTFDPAWQFGGPWPADEAVIALNSAWIRQNAVVHSDATVLDQAPAEILTDDAELVLGLSARVDGDVAAHRIRLKTGATVLGSAAFNDLVNNGTISGAELTPLSTPIPLLVPTFPNITLTSPSDVTVQQNTALTIAAGDYGTVTLLQNATLTLSGGLFEMAELEIGQGSALHCASASCEIRVQGKLLPGRNAYIGPAPGSNLTANDVEIFVGGINGGTGSLGATPKAATIGDANTLVAKLFVPNGSLHINEHSVATATLIGKDVQIGIGAEITSPEPPSEGEPDCAALCADEIAAACAESPTDQAQCELDCETRLSEGFCQSPAEDFVLCANAAASASCTPEGDPTFAGCEDGETDLETCEEVCSEDDGNDCTEIESCDPLTGPVHVPLQDNAACDDGSACTQTDSCQNGTCAGSNPVTCVPLDQCHEAGTCNPATGICSQPSKPNGSPCNDGSACSQADSCQNGTCVGESPVTCQPLDQCHDAGTCNPSTGTCSNPPKPDSTPCEDGNGCTEADTCSAGTCTSGPPVMCVPIDACHLAGTCEPSTGLCSTPPTPPGESCADASFCNGSETCDGQGTCTPGTPPTLDDGNVCTLDTCDEALGVLHTPTPGAICGSATSPCESAEMCDATGACVGGPPPSFDDGDPCTVDACTEESGITHDPAGAGADCGEGLVCVEGGACIPLPLDPSLVAPEIDRTVSSTVFATTSFLYTGADPIQTGVAAGTIEPARAAVLRGAVIDRDSGLPLPGVLVAIRDHVEYGETFTRADGRYDLAVNGGGLLDLHFEKPGRLPVQRRVDVTMQDYTELETVALIPLDPEVTSIDFSEPIQIARGSVVNDGDGTRQPTLLVPSTVTATMVMPDESVVPLPTMSIRLTEYTAGPDGPAALPERLPASSGYTYALELSADEAIAAGATRIEFSDPIPLYVENFLGFAVGDAVPFGIFDRTEACWVPQDNGRVVGILSVSGGFAELDLDGTGIPATPAMLLALGISGDERAELAALYVPGDSLWRIPVNRFSPGDPNWPFGFPAGAGGPGGSGGGPGGGGGGPGGGGPGSGTGKPCEDENASSVEVQTQILKESLPIVGTPFRLHYQSDRVPGRAGAFKLPISLVGPVAPPSLTRIDLKVEVAGEVHRQSFSPTPNGTFEFVWDGRDHLGRLMQGQQAVDMELAYVYPGVYLEAADLTRSFGAFSSSGSVATAGSARIEFTLAQSWRRLLGVWDARPHGLGGWTLSAHHAYDVGLRVLYRGDGGRQATGEVGAIIRRVAGGGPTPTPPAIGPSFVEGRRARDISFGSTVGSGFIRSLAAGADGSVYISVENPTAIYRVDPEGIIHHVAGTGTAGYTGDGGPATAARTGFVTFLAVGPDGSVYLSETNNARIRHIGLDGIIRTIAGTGVSAPTGNGGPAPTTPVRPWGVAVAPDNTLYFAARDDNRVYRLTCDGVIQPVAGTGAGSVTGDGGPAIAAGVVFPLDVAVGPDGSLFVGHGTTGRVRRIRPDGIITRVAGGGSSTLLDIPATSASIPVPTAIEVDRLGNLFLSGNGTRVLIVGPDGILHAVTGVPTSSTQPIADGLPAPAVTMQPHAIAMLPSGGLALGRFNRGTVHVVQQPGQSFNGLGFVVPSEDGTEVYELGPDGRHLRTFHALTGAVLLAFEYDSAGRLESITDGDGRTTTIARDGGGAPIAILSPFGQETSLETDPSGYLSTITNPANETHGFAYTPDGLMEEHTDPRGHVSTYLFNTEGDLMLIERLETGTSRSYQGADAFLGGDLEVTTITAQGRTKRYDVLETPSGAELRTVVLPDGVSASTQYGLDGLNVTSFADGTVVTTRQGPDPRFDMLSPIQTLRTLATGGRTQQWARTRAVTLADPDDVLSVDALMDSLTVNGRTFTTTFDLSPVPTRTRVTPAGRQAVTEMDLQGRPTRTEVLGALGLAPTLMEYDDGSINPLHAGMLRAISQGSGAAERRYELTYDADGNLDQVIAPLGQLTNFEYDAAARLGSMTLPDGELVRFEYDASGNLHVLAQPGTRAFYDPEDIHQLDHEARSFLSAYTAPDVGLASHTTSYDYSADGDLELITRPDAMTLDSVYDSAGRLSQQITPNGIVEHIYFPASDPVAPGKLQAIVNQVDNVTLALTYAGRLLTSTTWSGAVNGSLSATYDNDLRVTSDTVAGNTAVYTYGDADGLLTQAGALALTLDPGTALLTGTSIGAVTGSIGYNEFGEPTSFLTSHSGSPLYEMNLTFDALGRITFKSETIAGTTTGYEYRYDDANRLAEVYQGAGSCNIVSCTLAESYTYDANGNRLSLTDSGGTRDATYDAQDRLLTLGAVSYGYTAAGELAAEFDSSGTTSYTYDALGNLKRVDLPTGTVVEYLVDGMNRRVGKLVDGAMTQAFLYGTPPGPIADLGPDGATLEARFVYATRGHVPDYIIKGGNTYRLVTDQLGSVRLVVDVATGVVAQRIDYDAWGKVLSDSTPGFQPFGFAGGLYDPDTGLVRFGARDYDAEVGRWTAKDPILFEGVERPSRTRPGTNLFGYALGDPVNRHDPEGAIPVWWWSDPKEKIGDLLCWAFGCDEDEEQDDGAGVLIPIYERCNLLGTVKLPADLCVYRCEVTGRMRVRRLKPSPLFPVPTDTCYPGNYNQCLPWIIEPVTPSW